MRRFALLLGVVFVAASCNEKKEVSIKWENNKAVSVTIPASDSVEISVEGSEFNVLGILEIGRSEVTFTPAVPFQRGQIYNVSSVSGQIYSFTVPADTAAKAPRLVASYPSCDTVPENLLKIYLQFDQPMSEGRSYEYITLQDGSDTVKGAFLDLKPELWNEDQTVLTLWLDPGRIKQDLIPNKQLGAVLNKGRSYTLHVAAGWMSKSGLRTDQYVRNFLTKNRDTKKPDVATWNIEASRDRVTVNVGESLDWSLLNSTISVRGGEDEIGVNVTTNECERQIQLVPVEPFTPGTYELQIESRLEDLAGNNLNRLFETDVTANKPTSENKSVHTLTFTVR